MDKILLTHFSKSSGCGCKVAPALLQGILDPSFNVKDQKVLVGIDSFDDATVIAINDSDCIVSTTDFFTPIVDDPFDFGCIAAANALSDVYAMGGKPIAAISVLGFPVDKIPAAVVRQILAGAQEKCNQAGFSISGGHSIDAPEPFFGLCVTGTVKKHHIKRNNTARAGDKIYLTKPLGSGIFSTALKRGLLSETDYVSFLKTAARLNSIGEILGSQSYVTSMTDITGFGLLGHLVEVCEGSTVSAQINSGAVPLLPNLKVYIDAFCFPDSTYRNWNACEKKVSGLAPGDFIPFNDPQTNGGLLVTITAGKDMEFTNLLKANREDIFEIGVMVSEAAFRIYL